MNPTRLLVVDDDPQVLDVRMPGMDGVELARRLGQNPHGPGCLALTSYNDEVAMVTLLRAGARGHVKKSAPRRRSAGRLKSPPGEEWSCPGRLRRRCGATSVAPNHRQTVSLTGR